MGICRTGSEAIETSKSEHRSGEIKNPGNFNSLELFWSREVRKSREKRLGPFRRSFFFFFFSLSFPSGTKSSEVSKPTAFLWVWKPGGNQGNSPSSRKRPGRGGKWVCECCVFPELFSSAVGVWFVSGSALKRIGKSLTNLALYFPLYLRFEEIYFDFWT